MKGISASYLALNASVAPLLDAQIADDDPRFDDHMVVMGTEFFGEAFASQEARDKALGPVNKFYHFVAADPMPPDYALHQVAIGHGLYEPGFGEIAAVVLPAVTDHAKSYGVDHIRVIIKRIAYTLEFDASLSRPRILMSPVFGGPMGDVEQQTATWLAGYFSASTKQLAA